MSRFVALLRGVNVGKGKRVPMADPRTLLEGLGFASVRTLLNSGNAGLDACGGAEEDHADNLAAAVLGKAGRHVTTRNWATVLKLEAVLLVGET